MKKINSLFLVFSLFLGMNLCISKTHAQVFVDLETGLLFTGYNDVRIPGDVGTFFSLKDDLQDDVSVFYRIRAGYTFRERHTVSALYAPLLVTSGGTFDRSVNFEGQTFQPGINVKGFYKFNSYRLTYRYDFLKRSRLSFGIGFTAKIRDAEIRLESEQMVSSKPNVGFVPIINFRANWKINDNISLLLVGDALAAKQGRAEDVLLAATYKYTDHFTVRAGYRILEGGADNDEVYNFALFHYASIGITYTYF